MTSTGELDRLSHTVLFPGFAGTQEPPVWLRARLRRGLGGVVLFSRNIESVAQTRALTDQLRAERRELLVATDEEGGDVTRLHAATGSPHPGALALGHQDDPKLTASVAAAIAGELSCAGIDWNLAPVSDVNNNPANPVIGVRSFGADPQLVARHVAAYVRATQQRGIIACAKHFPGHGDTAVDSHLGLPVLGADQTELEAVHLAPFRAAIAAGVRSVMTGHLLVPAWDNDLPATLSEQILTGVLRGRLGFTGVIMTDALEMAGVAGTVGIERGTVLALRAGADALCLGGGLADDDVVARTQGAILAAVRSGELPVERLRAAAERIAVLQQWRSQQQGSALPSVAVRRGPIGVSVQGDVRLAPGSVHVITLDPASNQAVGPVPWGIAARLQAARPGTTTSTVAGGDAASQVDTGDPARQLVVVVRDPHRHPWAAAALARLLSGHPGAIVVDMGLPAELPSAGQLAGVIRTHGVSTTAADATLDLLSGMSEECT